MKKLINNYHTHTYRCGHALGSDEEYVTTAIDNGFKILGFSDHIPFPSRPQKGMRQNTSDISDYISSINKLKEKFKDKIEIHVGYESEYYSEFNDYYLELKSKGIEYFILGQHCFFDKNNQYVFFNDVHNDINNVNKYIDEVIIAMNTNLFSYVAHPDMILNSVDVITDEIMEKMKRIIFESIKLDIPLEINCGGIRYKLNGNVNQIGEKSNHFYPYDEFFKLVGEYGAKVVIGIDAHSPSHINNTDCINKAFELVEKYNLNLVDVIEFK